MMSRSTKERLGKRIEYSREIVQQGNFDKTIPQLRQTHCMAMNEIIGCIITLIGSQPEKPTSVQCLEAQIGLMHGRIQELERRDDVNP